MADFGTLLNPDNTTLNLYCNSIKTNSPAPPSNPNILLNDSGIVQASGVVFVSDGTTIGGTQPTENLSITDQTNSINILNNSSLVYNNTLTGHNYNVNIDDSGYLNINNSVKQQQINCNSVVNIDGALTLQASSILNFVDVGTNIQVYPENGNLYFKGATDSYNFDVNVASNGLNITGNSALHGDVNIYNIGDNTKVSTITENINGDLIIYNNNNGQVSIQNASLIGLQGETHVIGYSLYIDKSDKTWHMGVDENTNQALFNGASSYGFDNNINTSGNVNSASLTVAAGIIINGNSLLQLFNAFNNNPCNLSVGSTDNLNIACSGSGVVLVNNNQVQDCSNGAIRPSSPVVGQMFFDTNISIPIWWSNLGGWVNALGALV